MIQLKVALIQPALFFKPVAQLGLREGVLQSKGGRANSSYLLPHVDVPPGQGT